MKSPRFELNKASRLLNTRGLDYTFMRDVLDTYGEPTGQTITYTVHGVFHATTHHIQVNETDAASVRRKTSPFIFALYDAASVLKQGDYTIINDTKYLVSDVIDYGNWNIAADISLEVCV